MPVDHLIINVHSSMSYPRKADMPAIENGEAPAGEYVRAVDAGTSLVHHHDMQHLGKTMSPDGRKLSHTNYGCSKEVTERIRAEPDRIIQFGVASARTRRAS